MPASISLPNPPRTPPPHWPEFADIFGEDEFGVFCEFVIADVRFVMRWIPPGRFLMGSPELENGRNAGEGPQHSVTISKGFWMGETPVTQGQWRAVVKAADDETQLPAAPSHFKGKDLHPVESVTWPQCVAFCDRLTSLLGHQIDFCLPSEAEWEYACRAGTDTAFSDGSACTIPNGLDPALEKLGWFNDNSGRMKQAVRQKQCNAWGLYDVHGNVWEWCWDGKRSYQRAACVDPLGSLDAGAGRVLRGGSLRPWAGLCRSAFRGSLAPGVAWRALGLRLSAGQERVQSGTSAQASPESS
ncbi:MAG: formylglycine-generating enzyme family protein [Planctomycetaceae bacterium]